MTTSARSPVRSHPWAALSGSVVVHAVLLAVAAALPAAAIAQAHAPCAPDRPARLTFAPHQDAPEPLIATTPVADVVRVPAPPPERDVAADLEFEIDVAQFAAEPRADEPVATEPNAGPPSPSFEQARRVHDAVSLRPGHGGAGTGDGAAGAIGLGGPGGAGGTTGLGDGGGNGGSASFGTGHGTGSDGSGSGWSGAGGATCGPSIVGELPAPAYPSKARARGWQGRVVLVLTIDAHGRVTAAEVAESSGRSALDDAARDAASDWTFAPALRDGVPVAGSLRVPVRFELTD